MIVDDDVEQLKKEVIDLKRIQEQFEIKIAQAEVSLRDARQTICTLQQENTANSELLKKQSGIDKQHVCNIERLFDLNHLESDQNIAFYTGFPNYDTFTSIFNYLNPGTHGGNIRYDREIPDDFYDITDGDEESEKENRKTKKEWPKKLTPMEGFFMVLSFISLVWCSTIHGE